MTAVFSEFTSPERWKGDRRSPTRWILSYISHQWHLAFIMLFGAFSNAALAAAVPVLIGQAFNVILKPPPDTSTLLRIAIWIGATQVVRGALQFARNFSAELIGQRIERDIRHELYVSLLGKGMTFHSLQPVGIPWRAPMTCEVNLFFSPGVKRWSVRPCSW
jgi:ATP-binding cassette subfamily B protein